VHTACIPFRREEKDEIDSPVTQKQQSERVGIERFDDSSTHHARTLLGNHAQTRRDKANNRRRIGRIETAPAGNLKYLGHSMSLVDYDKVCVLQPV
jgi:hypothetical protein